MENATTRVLDRLAAQDKAAGGTGSDYATAKRLGVATQMVSKWRSGRDQMSDAMAIRAAELLGVEPLRLIGDIRMERARDEREKKFWQRTVKGAGGKVAGLVLAVMMTAMGYPQGARAASQAPVFTGADSTIYTMRTLRRRRRRWWWVLWHPIADLSFLTGAPPTVPALG